MNIIHLHPEDNIALAKEPIAKGTRISQPVELLALDAIDAMHKIALSNIAQGEAISKYGQIIGVASQDIKAGEHVHSHNCVVADFERDYAFCQNAQPTDYVASAERASFMGYHRSNGQVGTRNYIGIITTVNCSATVARNIASHFNHASVLDNYANVDGVVPLVHTTGCGMSADGEGFELLKRTLTGYARHPNFAAVLTIGLGCETMQISRMLEDTDLADGELFRTLNIQEAGGTRKSIDAGKAIVTEMLEQVNCFQRQKTCASKLKVAVQCGGSDGFSGITANPALGAAADLIVRQGGTTIYSETPEIFGAEHLMTQRAEAPEVAEKLLAHVRWWQDYTRKNGVALDNNPSPGNKAGGLTTILEKSLGAQAKSGSTNLCGVYAYAEPIEQSGLVFMDSPGFDPVSVTGQVASGANVICFTTGRGSAFGQKPVPSIKLASNTALYQAMLDDIDINCGGILDGEYSIEECGQLIFEKILAIASGEPSKSEALGYGDNEFAPWQMGAVV